MSKLSHFKHSNNYFGWYRNDYEFLSVRIYDCNHISVDYIFNELQL